MSSIVPPNEGPLITTSLRIPEKILQKLDAAAAESGYKRTDIVLHFLRWALSEYEAEKAEKKPKK